MPDYAYKMLLYNYKDMTNQEIIRFAKRQYLKNKILDVTNVSSVLVKHIIKHLNIKKSYAVYIAAPFEHEESNKNRKLRFIDPVTNAEVRMYIYDMNSYYGEIFFYVQKPLMVSSEE